MITGILLLTWAIATVIGVIYMKEGDRRAGVKKESEDDL